MTVSFIFPGYEKMLKALLDMGYQFKLFPKRARDVEKTGVIYLRHDVDISPWAALGLAQVEYKLGIRSSYFFMLDNAHYNIFSKPNKTLITALDQRGHYIGPHVEPSQESFDVTGGEVQAFAKILQEHFTEKTAWVFSYHWGTRRLPPAELAQEPAGLIHTYLPEFTKEIEYVSDSEGYWQYGDPIERARAHPGKSMQILIHPEWWASEWEYTPKQRLSNLRELMIEDIDRYFDEDILPGEWI